MRQWEAGVLAAAVGGRPRTVVGGQASRGGGWRSGGAHRSGGWRPASLWRWVVGSSRWRTACGLAAAVDGRGPRGVGRPGSPRLWVPAKGTGLRGGIGGDSGVVGWGASISCLFFSEKTEAQHPTFR